MRRRIVLLGLLLFLVLIVTTSTNALSLRTSEHSENVDLNKQLQQEHGAILTFVQSVLIITLMILLLYSMKRLYLQLFSHRQ